MKVSIATLLFFSFSFVCFAQLNNTTNDLCKDVRLDPKKPSVFITFERFGERTPLRQDENNEGVWLRIHNNTKWKIYLKAYGADNERNEYQVSYEVRRIPGLEWKRKESELPLGYRIIKNYRIRAIEPGKSIVFSVPKQNLADGLAIFVGFSYEWELFGESGGDLSIQHQAPFWSTDLPDEK
ncbi:MAG: hypothetical protein KatS3mg006_2285 [Pyrinomonadaceae bacterium]|jgi:hypothetical protein|nr:MAG: hypothetical protein KatS3mg006_2285 [Pyrinomonadaceae bacterium]